MGLRRFFWSWGWRLGAVLGVGKGVDIRLVLNGKIFKVSRLFVFVFIISLLNNDEIFNSGF